MHDFVKSVMSYLLNKNVRAILIDAMKSGMNSQKLVSTLETDEADYWKMLKGIDPTTKEIQSLDEVLCNQGIKCLMRSFLTQELKHSSDNLDRNLKRAMFKSGEFPADIENMFACS